MVLRTCHRAAGGPRRDRALEVPREHRREPDSGTAAGWSDHYAGQPADPRQGDDHPGDRTGRLLRLRRGPSMGADPEPLIREYDSSHGTPQANAAAGVPGPAAPLRLSERRRPNWSVALLVLLAAVIGLVTYHLVASQPAGSGTAAGRKPVAAHQAGRKHPAATNTAAPPAARHGSPDVVISLTAVSEPCWADLTTSSGAPIFQGIIDPGTSETWTELRAVTLRLGNPGAITLTVDGKSHALGSAPVTLSLAPGQRISGLRQRGPGGRRWQGAA